MTDAERLLDLADQFRRIPDGPGVPLSAHFNDWLTPSFVPTVNGWSLAGSTIRGERSFQAVAGRAARFLANAEAGWSDWCSWLKEDGNGYEGDERSGRVPRLLEASARLCTTLSRLAIQKLATDAHSAVPDARDAETGRKLRAGTTKGGLARQRDVRVALGPRNNAIKKFAAQLRKSDPEITGRDVALRAASRFGLGASTIRKVLASSANEQPKTAGARQHRKRAAR
jgi:hypothetical protein